MSAAGGDRDDLDFGAIGDGGGWVVGRQDGLAVQFDDEGFSGEAEFVEQSVDFELCGFEGPGGAVDG